MGSPPSGLENSYELVRSQNGTSWVMPTSDKGLASDDDLSDETIAALDALIQATRSSRASGASGLESSTESLGDSWVAGAGLGMDDHSPAQGRAGRPRGVDPQSGASRLGNAVPARHSVLISTIVLGVAVAASLRGSSFTPTMSASPPPTPPPIPSSTTSQASPIASTRQVLEGARDRMSSLGDHVRLRVLSSSASRANVSAEGTLARYTHSLLSARSRMRDAAGGLHARLLSVRGLATTVLYNATTTARSLSSAAAASTASRLTSRAPVPSRKTDAGGESSEQGSGASSQSAAARSIWERAQVLLTPCVVWRASLSLGLGAMGTLVGIPYVPGVTDNIVVGLLAGVAPLYITSPCDDDLPGVGEAVQRADPAGSGNGIGSSK